MLAWVEEQSLARMGPHDSMSASSALCPVCKERPGRPQQVPNAPVSQFMCDECARDSFVLSPFKLLTALVTLAGAVYLLWRYF